MEDRDLQVIKFPALSNDLRKKNSEMCRQWGCEKYAASVPCMYCPVIADLAELLHENRMTVEEWNYDSQGAYAIAR